MDNGILYINEDDIPDFLPDENGEITAKDFVGISQHMVQVAKDFNMSKAIFAPRILELYASSN